jgi:hypothetical protein
VLDRSEAALHQARVRFGKVAGLPTWIASDVIGDWTLKPMDIWHGPGGVSLPGRAA